MVRPAGFEPALYALEERCLSTRLRTDKEKPYRKYYVLEGKAVLYGAGDEVRTRDIYLGKVVLYQLSYSRIKVHTTYPIILRV